MIGWQVIDELETVWNKPSWPNFKVLSRRSPGGTEENHEKPQNSRPLGRDLSQGSPEYDAGDLTSTTTFGVSIIIIIIIITIKSIPATRHGGAWGERRYSSYSFTTSALDGGERSASRPGRALHPGKGTPVHIVQEAGWAPEPARTQRIEEKSFAPAGNWIPIARSSSP
jgi:hypothetical protein